MRTTEETSKVGMSAGPSKRRAGWQCQPLIDEQVERINIDVETGNADRQPETGEVQGGLGPSILHWR